MTGCRDPGRKPAFFFLGPSGDLVWALVVVMALIVGVFGVFGLYYGMDWLINQMSEADQERVRPLAFVGPTILTLTVFLVSPTLNTVYLGFRDKDGEEFIGMDNYFSSFTNTDTLIALRNSIAWAIVVVITTVIITVWKVFDVVFVMTGGRFGTSVVAERMVTEFFTFRNNGTGTALAVVLLVAIIPLMFVNVKRFQQQEELR